MRRSLLPSSHGADHERASVGSVCTALVAIASRGDRDLGERLLSQLIGVAQIRGLKSMIGDVLEFNAAMLALALELGFNVGASGEHWSVRRVSLAQPER